VPVDPTGPRISPQRGGDAGPVGNSRCSRAMPKCFAEERIRRMWKRSTGWRSSESGDDARRKPFRGLAARITLFVFWATVITSLAVTALSIHSIHGFLRQNIDQKYPAVLSAVGDRLDLWFDQRTLEIGVFANSEILRDNVALLDAGTPTPRTQRARLEVEQYLSYLLDSFPQYRMLVLLDAEGHELLWAGEYIDLPESLLGDLASSSGPSISPVQHVAGQRLQVVSAALGADRGKATYSLHALLDLEALDQLLAAQDLAGGMRAIVVDTSGQVVASSDASLVASDHRWSTAERGDPLVVVGYAGEGGEEMVGSVMALGRLGWSLVVEEPYEQAFAPVISSVSKVLLIDLAILFVFGLGAYRIAVSIVKPIEALSDAARRMANGEEHVVIPERGARNEMGLLIRTFNTMTMGLANKARELELSRRQVEDANRQLTARNEDLQRVNEILEQLSITDGLTQLHNHRFFQDHLVRETRRVDRTGEPLALILADIDHFKAWNDRMGHAAGDRILREVADLMNGLVRETDLLARYGGEEFALLAPGTDEKGAVLLAEKIRAAISSHAFFVSPDSAPEGITMSFGVSVYSGDRERMFEEADRALYAAKAAGRDCVVNAADVPA